METQELGKMRAQEEAQVSGTLSVKVLGGCVLDTARDASQIALKAPLRIFFRKAKERVCQGCLVEAKQVVFDDICDIWRAVALVETTYFKQA